MPDTLKDPGTNNGEFTARTPEDILKSLTSDGSAPLETHDVVDDYKSQTETAEVQEKAKKRTSIARRFVDWTRREHPALETLGNLIKPVGYGSAGVLIAALGMSQPDDGPITTMGIAMAIGGAAIGAYIGHVTREGREEAAKLAMEGN